MSDQQNSGRLQPDQTVDTGNETARTKPQLFDLFVGKRFCEFELTAITKTLLTANTIANAELFRWRYVSATPGLVNGQAGLLVRAEPAIDDYGYGDALIVVGGQNASEGQWLRRARAMQRRAQPVVLLSDAATAYIRAAQSPKGRVTTHWRDIAPLMETGYHPALTTRLCENSDGIITAAGAGATSELVIGLVAPFLTAPQVADLGNQLMLHTIRKSDAEQPKRLTDNEGLFDAQVTQAIRLMEDTISDPMPMADLTAQVGLSTRHLERVFRKVFDDTPARFYKRLRTKHARAMIEETLLPLVEVAVATGFGSSEMLAKAIKEEYGLTPTKMRERRKINLLSFE